MSEAQVLELGYNAPGPVASRFLASRAPVQILNGPVGSGKTTANFIKHIINAQAQRPSTKVQIRIKGRSLPLRKYKMTVVRDDYRQLWRSTIPSWFQRFPQTMGVWNGARNAPATHEITFLPGDGTAVEFIAEFVAIGDNDIEDFMRGYEPTAFYLNELDLLAREVMQHALFRAGRYPRMDEGGPSWSGVTADCNAPVLDSWLYNEIFVGNTPDGEAAAFDRSMIDLFRQPGGTEAGAENIKNLPPGYYDRQVRMIADRYLVRRMVFNQPAPSRSGKPVHEEFNDLVHVAPADLDAVPGVPLVIGLDAGLDPAAAVMQKLGSGRWHGLDEIASEHGTGALRFAAMLNELLLDRYPGWHRLPSAHEREWGWQPRHGLPQSNIRAWCDPAATYGGDRSSAAEADRTWQELVSYHTGIRIEPCATNNTTDRREALARLLRLMVDSRPAFVLSPRCKMIRAGLAGQFRYRRVQLAREERYTDEVEKNAHSHVCEAAEYALLGGGEIAEVHERRARGWNVRALPRQAQDDWVMGGGMP